MKKPAASLTSQKETAVRKQLDLQLTSLGWNSDESSPTCAVFTERAKTVAQQGRLPKGVSPDYLLYETTGDRPLAVVEAKRPGQSLLGARDQAVVRYATPLDIDIVFVSDGAIVETYDRRVQGPLRLDGEIVTELLSESLLLRFVNEGPDIRTPERVRHTKADLIAAFEAAEELLRKDGLRQGLERFTEFSNLLFLKMISEFEAMREAAGEPRILDKQYCWDYFAKKPANELYSYINDTVLPRLVNKYNHSGEVFQHKLLIQSPKTLQAIVGRLSQLRLIDAESDVKGDAFEFFLKNSVSVGNDLGEYFTPRHVVKLAVDLVDPRWGETVYDPCCGTGGFLIQTFKHLYRKVKHTPENLERLKEATVYGREITGTAKIAKMNMIIIGDGHTNVDQVDSLSKPVVEQYEVVVTNYPFSQKTDFGHYYGLDTENANPVFLMHAIKALRPGGRAAIVVPQGTLFDESAAFVTARKTLLEQCSLEAVINFHEYVFRPYAGQATSLLVFTKGAATSRVWFFDVQEDGFKKTGSKMGRPPIIASDLPLLRQLWSEKTDSSRSMSVEIADIRAHNCKLSMVTYREKSSVAAGWLPLGGAEGVCNVVIGGTPPSKEPMYWNGPHMWATISDLGPKWVNGTARTISDDGVARSSVKPVPQGALLFSFKLTIGKVSLAGSDMFTNEAIAALVPKDDRVSAEYLYYVLREMDPARFGRAAAKGKTLTKKLVEDIRAPIPSLEEQARVIQAMRAYDEELATLAERAGTVRAQQRGVVRAVIDLPS